MAHALRQMIDQSGRVIIMGHRNLIWTASVLLLDKQDRKNRNKEGAIVLRVTAPR